MTRKPAGLTHEYAAQFSDASVVDAHAAMGNLQAVDRMVDRDVPPQPVVVEIATRSGRYHSRGWLEMLQPQPPVERLQAVCKASPPKDASHQVRHVSHRMQEELGALRKLMTADAQR